MFEASLNQLSSVIGDNKLLPVISLEENDRYKVLNLVIEKKVRRFFWHRNIYEPVKYVLHDLISPLNDSFEKEIEVKLHDKIFSCNSTKTFTAHGKIGGKLLHLIEASISADDCVTVTANFGYINKASVDVESLEKHLQSVRIDMNNEVVKSLALHTNNKLCIVVETLSNDSDATLNSTSKLVEQENIGIAPTIPKEDENASSSNTMSLAIPTGSTLFYSVVDLDIDEQGKVTVSAKGRTGIQHEYNDIAMKEQFGLLFTNGYEKALLHSILTSCDNPSAARHIQRMLIDKKSGKEFHIYKSIFEVSGFKLKNDVMKLSVDNATYEQMVLYYKCIVQLNDISLTLIHGIPKEQLQDLISMLISLVTPGARQPLNSDPAINNLSTRSLAWLNTIGVKFAEGSSEGENQTIDLGHVYTDDTCKVNKCKVHDIIHAALHVLYVIRQLHLNSKSSCHLI